METELRLLWVAIVAYVLSGSVAIFGLVLKRRPERFVLTAMAGGLLFHVAAIALRWDRLGHGPFVTLFEILSSNVWSLTLIYCLAYWRYRAVRPAAAFVMPLLFVLMGWLMLSSPEEGHFPVTYRTPWLYIHVGLSKVFLGCVLIALGMAIVVLLRRRGIALARLAGMPADGRLDDLAYRFMALGLVFQSLMLVSGAIWAQDAWGRYWAWDPLETWSFVTWLLLAFALHLRLTLRTTAPTGAWMIVAVFGLAFLTFFGVPFVTTAPHKGAI
ncbi:MAG TPA: cytochrome c biogenesis protein CcsA [Rhodocyclaceae bacterium]|nr:cytochrome c biogenesis protein CcsA [Rhodocyclaceae bacterium]HNH34848.1 cytochrome c biogenesis protein CcsA [Rhodocyclaceae bacterium]